MTAVASGRLKISVTVLADLEEMLHSARDADLLEFRRYSPNGTAGAELARSMAESVVTMTARVDGELAAIWGMKRLGSAMRPRGGVWLMTTSVVERHAKTFVRMTRFYLDKFYRDSPGGLEAHVDYTYSRAVRWLEREGFQAESFADCNDNLFLVMVKP